jgi:Ca2+-binding RTX toxin-like protein
MMLRTAVPVDRDHAPLTAASRLLLVGAVLVAVLGVAAEADAAVLASVKNGTLTVRGGGAAEKVTLRRGAPGRLVVDVGDNGSADFTFLRSTFTRIVVNAGGGADRLRINESRGVFTNTEATTLNGQAGNDVVLGGSHDEVLRGGTENDTIDGNGGGDDVGMGSGNDSFVWNAGDGADEIRGDADSDTVTVNGSATGPDAITVSPTAVLGHALVSGGPDVATTETLIVNGMGGDDTLSGGNVVGLFQLTLDGGVGDDVLNGGNGNDILLGGADGDTIDGNAGADVAFLGTGDDAFVWDPGDGSDIVEGGTDRDELRFNGSAAAEIFAASANGSRLLFTRNLGIIVMDVDDVETLTVQALGGADTVTVNDLSATDVESVDVDLGVGGVGDAAVDSVTVNATNNANVVRISGASGGVSVLSPYVTVGIVDAEPANDSLIVNASTGADLVSASTLASTSVALTLNGSTGADILVGSQGGDTIDGGSGDDRISGEDGNDTIDGGADTDTIDGGAGIDSAVNGENVTNVP